MRKYRNGKQSREPRQLSKYSPEYIQYRENRGGYSVKVGLCDITGDGEEDTISVAWRNPANGKVQNCTVIVTPTPASGPTYLNASLALPTAGPSGLTANVSAPTSGPASLNSAIAVPTTGPSAMSASESLFFGIASNATATGYVDSAGREWFSTYDIFGTMYTFDVSSSGEATLNKPDGTVEVVSDINDPIPGNTGNWSVGNIMSYDYVGDGGLYAASFNLTPLF